MRFLRAILAGLFPILAVLAGLVAAAVIAVASVVFLLFESIRGRRSTAPASSIPHPRARTMGTMNSADAIDVTATEIPGEPERSS